MTRAWWTPQNRTRGVLAVSGVAFLLRAVQYAAFGSTFPSMFMIGVLGVFVLGAALGKRSLRRIVRSWGAFLVLYGTVRVGLGALILSSPVGSAHATDSASASFFLAALLYLAAGVYLVRRPNLFRAA